MCNSFAAGVRLQCTVPERDSHSVYRVAGAWHGRHFRPVHQGPYLYTNTLVKPALDMGGTSDPYIKVCTFTQILYWSLCLTWAALQARTSRSVPLHKYSREVCAWQGRHFWPVHQGLYLYTNILLKPVLDMGGTSGPYIKVCTFTHLQCTQLPALDIGGTSGPCIMGCTFTHSVLYNVQSCLRLT